MEENQTATDSNLGTPNILSTPPVSDSTPTQTPQPTSPKKSKLPMTIVVAIIFIILFVGTAAGFYVFKPQIMKLVSKPSPTVIPNSFRDPSPTPPPVGGPTANWKTYEGKGFSFKYPTEFANEKCPKGAFSTSLCTDGLDKSIEPIFYYIDFQNESVLPQIKGLKINYKEETINGVSVLRTNDLPSRSGAETVYFKNPNGDYVSVLFTPYDKQNSFPQQEKYYNLFGQILSTFKFIK